MKSVRVFPAGEFICENCGRNNFFSLIGTDVPDQLLQNTKEELAIELGLEEAQLEGSFLMSPETVICKFCESEFELEY